MPNKQGKEGQGCPNPTLLVAACSYSVGDHVFRLSLRSRLPLTGVEKNQNREKRVSESKYPHFPSPQQRAFRVRKSPFSMWCPVEKPNAILSLLHPLDCYWTPSATGNAIGRPYLALSRICTQVGVLNLLALNHDSG